MTRRIRRSHVVAGPCARGGYLLPPGSAEILPPPTASTASVNIRWRAMAYALVCVSTLALSACTFADSNTSNGKASPPPAKSAAAALAAPTPMDTFRTLAPPEGMKFTPLFSAPAGSDDARFDRLEQAVQSLRNDFDTVTPTLVRLAAIEKDIRDLVGQLRTLTDGGPIVESVPVPAVDAAASLPAPSATTAAPPVVSKTTTTTTTTKTTTNNEIPGEDKAGGTEATQARMAKAVPTAPTSPVTPEAAPTGQLPPDGAASPLSAAKPAPAAPAPLPPEPLPLTPQAAKPPAATVAKPATAPPPAAPVPSLAKDKPDTKTAASPAAAMPVPTPTPAQRPPGGQTQPVAPVPVPDTAPPAAELTPAPVTPSLPEVTMGEILGDLREVRVGDHIDKTRIVLDASVKAPYKARIDTSGKRLLIELPQYAWKGAAEWKASRALLVSGYIYKDGLLVINLLHPAVISEQTSISASGGAGERIVIDLYASAVHTR